MREQTMETGDADVEVAFDRRTEKLRGDGGLFGNGKIAGAGAEDGHGTGGRRLRCWLAQCGGASDGMELCSGHARGDSLPCCFADAGGEDIRSGGCGAGEYLGDVVGRFAFGVDDFGNAETQAAMMIDAGEA